MDETQILQQWSYDTKLKSCSNLKEHDEDCDGNCEEVKATKGQVDLHNEIAIWAVKGVPIVGKPAVIAAQIPIPGFPVEILSTDKRLESLLEFLYEKNIIDKDEFMEFHRVRFMEFLKSAREHGEREEARAKIIRPDFRMPKLPTNGPLH